MSIKTQALDYAGSTAPMFSEILKKVSDAKDKASKISILKENDSVSLRQVLKGAFYSKIEWDLPTGNPPYTENDAPAGTEHTTLHTEARLLWHFVKGADPATSRAKKENMFIQMLEGLHAEEAKLLLNVKDKKLSKVYKGLTESVVKSAFDWNDDYKTA